MGDYIFSCLFHFLCVFFGLNSGGVLLHRAWASFPRPPLTAIHLYQIVFQYLSLPYRWLWLVRYHDHPVHASATVCLVALLHSVFNINYCLNDLPLP